MLLLCPIELAAGFEPAGPSRCDLVVKLTMTPGRHELAVLAAQQEPLSPGGSRLFPPDAGRRPSPEALIVGPALEDPSGPVTLTVGARAWNERSWQSLGPAAHPDGGFVRSEQRVRAFELPLMIEAKGRSWMTLVIPAPMPMFGVASSAARSPIRPVSPRLEVLAIDPARRLVMLTFRLEIPESTERIVVNPNARATLPAGAELTWPEQQVVPLVAGATVSSPPAPGLGLPFSRSKGVTVDAPRHVRSQALPFARAAASPLRVAPAAAAPPPDSTPIPPASPEGIGFETVLLGKSPAYTGNEAIRLTGVPFVQPSLPFQTPAAPTFGPRPGGTPIPPPVSSPSQALDDWPTFAGGDDVQDVDDVAEEVDEEEDVDELEAALDLDDDHETIPPAPRDTIPPSGRTLVLAVETAATPCDDLAEDAVTIPPPARGTVVPQPATIPPEPATIPPARATIPPDAPGAATLPPPAPSNGGLPFAATPSMPRPPSMRSTTFAELRALTSGDNPMTAMSSRMFDDDGPAPAPAAGARPVQPPATFAETTRLELTIEGFTLDQLSTIRAELQAAPRSKRRSILRKHKTTEVKWRLVERKWANHLRELEARPEQLVLVATSLQRKGKRRRSRSTERTA